VTLSPLPEGTISELVRGHGLRRARYKGFAKVDLQNQLVAAACNIKRWLRRIRLGASKPAPEAHLAPPQLLTCPLKELSLMLLEVRVETHSPQDFSESFNLHRDVGDFSFQNLRENIRDLILA
jgi:Transposase DDE domain